MPSRYCMNEPEIDQFAAEMDDFVQCILNDSRAKCRTKKGCATSGF